MFRWISSLSGSRGRWMAPQPRFRTTLAVLVVGLLASGSGVAWWLMSSPGPDRVLAQAYRFVDQPLAMRAPQDIAWSLSVHGGGGLASQSVALLAPPLPPALCLLAHDDTDPIVLDGLFRRLSRALASSEAVLVRSTIDAIEKAAVAPGTQEVLATYNLALGYAWADDPASAARLLSSLDLGGDSGGAVPVVGVSQAASLTRDVLPSEVILAYHIRYLAGLVAQSRARPVEAIAHFRRALNAVNYFVGGRSSAAGHYRRVAMAPGDWSCGGSAGMDLTSLDAYSGLVGAYLAAPEFRDPSRLPREVARQGFEIDAADPLAPVLRYAQRMGRDDLAGSIPEHVIWASSNLQRVYHYNRLQPDPGLSLTRAVLALQILDHSGWREALDLGDGGECSMLAEVASGLYRDGAEVSFRRGEPVRRDSAWAAVAVHTFARLETDCLGTVPNEVDSETRGRWLQLGGGYLHGGLIARYEGLRSQLEGRGVDPVTDARAVMDEVQADLAFFEKGRVPPDLSSSIDPMVAAEFVGSWKRGVFRDVASFLVANVEANPSGDGVRAGDVKDYLSAVNGAVAHAGMRPNGAYRPEALAILARSQGAWGSLTYRVSYAARSYPGLATGLIGGTTFILLAALVMGYVAWWRFMILTRVHAYRAETLSRSNRGLGVVAKTMDDLEAADNKEPKEEEP